MTAGPCEPADTLAVERVVLARQNVAACGPRWPLLPARRSHARFSARIGPNATSEAELFRSPCQRISLLVHDAVPSCTRIPASIRWTWRCDPATTGKVVGQMFQSGVARAR